MFKRRKRDTSSEQPAESSSEPTLDSASEPEVQEILEADIIAESFEEILETEIIETESFDDEGQLLNVDDIEATGPYDLREFSDDGIPRIDFGGMLIPLIEGMEIHVEPAGDDPRTAVGVTMGLGEAALQLNAFAAPRSGGFWMESLPELQENIEAQGGTTQVEGTEMIANVPATTPEGEVVTTTVRFVASEGSGWMLRGVLLGRAAVEDQVADSIKSIFKLIVVNRGDDAMPAGDPILLHIPDMEDEDDEVDEEAMDPAADRRSMPERMGPGPEITEIG